MDEEKVLLVDDEPQILSSIQREIGRSYHLVTAASGKEALDILSSQGPFAVVISDLQMPEMDGIALLDRIKHIAPDTTRIMLTGHADRDSVIEAINSGYLFRFLEKPIVGEQLVQAIDDGLLQYRGVKAQKELFALRKNQNVLSGVVRSFIRLMEKRDPYTAGHQERVAELATAIAREMGLSSEAIEAITTAGIIHDIGKVYVPSAFLNRPGKLSPVEFAVIKEHPTVGYSVLKEVEFERPVAEFVYQHHERLDGSGYPQGLSGDAIHLEARIICVADIVEAMSSHRPYRPALGLVEARQEILRGKGEIYDSEAVSACLRVLEKMNWPITT